MSWKNNRKARRTAAETPETAAGPQDLDAVVQDYAAQAEAADALAEVDTTHLDRPEANPHALATLNTERTRTARERIALDYERERMTAEADHARLVDRITEERRRAGAFDARADRAVTEAVADADEAADALAEVREFERAASPVSATRSLMRSARGWRREEFAYAIAGSALSAVGITALLVAVSPLTIWVAPVVAALAETVLTVRVIRLIGQRSDLAEQHKGAALDPTSAGAKALVFLTRQIVALLSVSIGLNLVGLLVGSGALGIIGALGAAGAAVASWSAWRTSQAATETVASNITAWQGSNWAQAREEMRLRAAGQHIPNLDTTERPQPQQVDAVQDEQAEIERIRRVLAVVAEEQIAALADRGTDALALMLNPPGTEGGAGAAGRVPQDPNGGATPADLQVPQGATPAATPAATPVAEEVPAGENEEGMGRTWPRPPTAEQGRRQLVEYARWCVRTGNTPSRGDAAERMSMSKRSIGRYHEDLVDDYPDLMGLFPPS